MLPTSHGSMITTLQRIDAAETITGLDEMEVRTRREAGDGNDYQPPTSRSLIDILRQNVFTLINMVLFTLGATMVSIGRVSEAITSVSLILMNVTVGVIQEVRAKRKLDQIALLLRPKVTVIREGEERAVGPEELVRGDIVVLRAGDQIVVDGIVVGDGQVEVDESLITGESDSIRKTKGDHVLSGSYVLTGKCLFVVRRVGAKSFANTVAAEARAFRVARTPLQRDVDFVIRILMLIALIFGFLLGISALLSDIPLMRRVQMATVFAGLVPNGLFFMVIVAYAMGAVRIMRRGALVQQANSVESLSNVNILCMDKTGTLTANRIVFHNLHPFGADHDDVQRLLGDFASSAAVTNRTSEALIAAFGGQQRRVLDEVPFSSERKWSAVTFSDSGPDGRSGVYVLGAPEVLAQYIETDGGSTGLSEQMQRQIQDWASAGLRVVLFAYNREVLYLHDVQGQPILPALVPLAVISFSDELRDEVKETLVGFAQAGVDLKIISGDNPHTVAALAKQVGLLGDFKVISGADLRDMNPIQFDQVAREYSIFGRITPLQKERLVEALRADGYYVAMIGDGVNDVLSLKKANLGIAMESSSSATRSVADIVLLNDSFSALPDAFLEGQRITSGMRDILRLYLARAVQLVLLILAAAVVGVGFPFIPKHISLVALLTIGTPTFALAVWARPEPDKRGLILSVVHFAFPAGIVTFLFALLLYTFTFDSIVNGGRTLDVMREDVKTFQTYAGIDYEIYTEDEFIYEVAVLFSQSVLTVFSVLAGLGLVLFVEPPYHWFVGGDKYSGDKRPMILSGIMLVLFALIMAVPRFRQFWELLPMEPTDYALVIGATLLWLVVLRFVWRAQLFEHFLHLEGMVDLSEDRLLNKEL
jgi:cation-transporting ATPase E